MYAIGNYRLLFLKSREYSSTLWRPAVQNYLRSMCRAPPQISNSVDTQTKTRKSGNGGGIMVQPIGNTVKSRLFSAII